MAAKAKKSRKKSKASAEAERPPEDAAEREDAAAPAAAPAPESSSKKKKTGKKKRKGGGDANVASETAEKGGGSGKSKVSKKATEAPLPPTESGSDEGESDDVKLTLEALDAISDDDSDDSEGDAENGDAENGDAEDGEGENYDAEALALRKMIQDGKFDSLLKNSKKPKKNKGKKMDTKEAGKKEKGENGDEGSDGSDAPNDEEMEEVVLDTDDESGSKDEKGDNSDEGSVGSDASNDEETVEVTDTKEEAATNDESGSEADEKQEGDNDSEESGSEDEEAAAASSQRNAQSLALTTALQAADRHLPWAETFAVVPPTPLPFGPPPSAAAAGKKRQRSDEEDDEDEHVDVHDDLKREVAFYDNALEGVLLARENCEKAGIPFTRPDDFFAEMVKSDEHMAKIKDRLIFETKRMEAVERRKSNKEQTHMAKERRAHRLAEKSRAKKAHMQSVEDWKEGVARGRAGLGGAVRDDDEERLRGMGGPNSRRARADKRYGFGGKRGRFKQNDAKTLNDMSGYNPRGGFGGIGQKSQGGGGKKKGGGGKKRPGKRARDAGRR